MDIKEVMQKFSDLIESKKKGKVIKSLPFRKKWQEIWNDLEEAKELSEAMEAKHDSKRKLFWSTVENDLGIYDKSLHYNQETNEIDVLADDEPLEKEVVRKSKPSARGSFEA